MTTLPRITGLDETSPAFRRRLVEVACARDLVPGYLAAVMAFESGLDPAARNNFSGATGLIQFMPKTAKLLGTTTDELRKMSGTKQLDYVDKFYAYIQKTYPHKIESIEDHYLAVLAPARMKSEVIYKAPSNAYEGNKALDTNGDGIIDRFEATAPVKRIYLAGRKSGTIEVDMGDDELPVLGKLLLFLGSIFVWARFRTNARYSEVI